MAELLQVIQTEYVPFSVSDHRLHFVRLANSDIENSIGRYKEIEAPLNFKSIEEVKKFLEKTLAEVSQKHSEPRTWDIWILISGDDEQRRFGIKMESLTAAEDVGQTVADLLGKMEELLNQTEEN